jgi:hypothetical protein
MPRRTTFLAGALALAFAALVFTPLALSGQTTRSGDRRPTVSPTKAWTPPRTPDGKPDLQGIWDFRTATPLERPREFAGKRFFTDEEAAEFEKRTAERIDGIVAVHPPFWLDYGMKVLTDKRTSLIVDPPDGRVPALTADAQKNAAARAAARRGPPDGPEDFNLGERCLLFSAGPPIVPGPYNNNLQIVQTPHAVVLLTEMIHDARIVPMDGRPHLPGDIRPWLGDSRGRWQGDTLVVETTNFSDRTSFRGSDRHLRLIERFSLQNQRTLMYEFTLDDPTAFTQPWTVALPMARTEDQIYEYACHEGNYGLVDMLRGARFEEKGR